MAQSVEHQTLDLGSGHDLTVHEIESRVELCADNTEAPWDSFSPSLSLPLPCVCICVCVLSLLQNKYVKKKTIQPII